jgi:hypothetical protein
MDWISGEVFAALIQSLSEILLSWSESAHFIMELRAAEIRPPLNTSEHFE